MPIVTFLPSGKTCEVPFGTLLFDAARQADLPVASSCSADNVCGRCNMQVVDGAENLSPQQSTEIKLLQRDKNPTSDRISCMTRVYGDCKVTTRYW
ncbi:MAG: 2Fe-2S iron-sulfur cluster binding domain-containing protein [Deltaproteobacteria bacterium]|nr:2Fe-2S iron-sulfur cluster binding domain-containing protein [Deltaproteobacteria bacterium]